MRTRTTDPMLGRVVRPSPARSRTPATEPPSSAAQARRLGAARCAIFFVAIAAALFVIYQPAIHGGLLWDDPAHVTRPELRSGTGLWRIWFEPGATQQYYPLVHSAFWVMARAFGDATTGYHVVNVLLHAASATLLLVILTTLGIPGAACIAALFAVHPVHVESVAWITELKNTLSGVFFLASLLLYLQFDRTRRWRPYAGSLFLFVCAILTKSVTVTLPVTLLVLFWWKRGRIDLRHDVGPTVPFLISGGAMGLVTALVERAYVGATGAEFSLSLLERTLLAGRVLCFYLAKLGWPEPLIFVYPRWDVSSGVWWQYLYPAAVVVAFVTLWRARRWSRAPFAALLMFVVALVPALGFINVYPFKFSFVADHFQYLASVPVLAFGIASVFWLCEKRLSTVATAVVVLIGIVGPMGVVARGQSHEYANAEVLYRSTIAKNPRAWLAYNNLAMLFLDGDPTPEDFEHALAEFDKALAIVPGEPTVQFNVGTALYRLQRFPEAIAHLRQAVAAAPEYVDAWGNLGAAQQKFGDLPAALESYRRTLELSPSVLSVRYNLSAVLLELGRTNEAAQVIAKVGTSPASANHRVALAELFVVQGQFEQAIEQYTLASAVVQLPTDSLDHMGYALLQTRRPELAESYFRQALGRRPDDAMAYSNLGNALQQMGRLQESLAAYRRALQTPEGAARPETHNDFGVALARTGQMVEATEQFREAVRLNPGYQAAQQNLAKALQTR